MLLQIRAPVTWSHARAISSQESAPVVSRPIDPRSLRRLFLDLLGRPPYPDERRTWIGKERADLIDSVLGGEEFWRNWLEEQLYYFLLVDNFRPTTESVQSIPGELTKGTLGL